MDLREQLKQLKLSKRDVSAHLGMTMPTLKSKFDNPGNLTITNVNKLRELGFKIEI